MPSAETQRGRLLVQLHTMTAGRPDANVELHALAAAAKVPLDQTRALCQQLADLNLVRITLYPDGGGLVAITTAGIDRAEHLAQPWWVRVWSLPGFTGAVAGAVSGAVAGFLGSFANDALKRLLGW